MDFARVVSALGGRLALSPGVLRLPKGARAVARGGAWALAAVSLGALADESAGRKAREAWEREHAPSHAVWRHALSPKGWETLSELDDRQRAARSLPASHDREPSVWLSRDRRHLAAFGEGGGETPWVFRQAARPGHRPPRAAADWERLGAGWEAFELALAKVAVPEPARRPSKGPQRGVMPRDRRAFDY